MGGMGEEGFRLAKEGHKLRQRIVSTPAISRMGLEEHTSAERKTKKRRNRGQGGGST